MFKRSILALTAASVVVVAPLSATAETINFGIISTESSANLKKQWVPFLDDMTKKIGLTIKPFFATDYAGVIEGVGAVFIFLPQILILFFFLSTTMNMAICNTRAMALVSQRATASNRSPYSPQNK